MPLLSLQTFPEWLSIAPYSIYNAANPNRTATHDAWTLVPAFMGLGAQGQSFQTLTNLVTTDRRLNWEGVLPVLRTFGLMYKSEVRTHTNAPSKATQKGRWSFVIILRHVHA